jgi:hypothetical protein
MSIKNILKYLVNYNIMFPYVLGVSEKNDIIIIRYNYDIFVRYAVIEREDNVNVLINLETGKFLPDRIKWCVDAYRNKISQISNDNINRFEVIDNTGRILLYYDKKIQLSYQDDARTLKVFVIDTH